jgi:hypothetical protein
MLDLKELLIMLGLAVGGPMPNQDMIFYRQKLGTELGMEQKLNAEIKALEYRKMWDEANKTEKTDFAANWFKEKKTDDKLTKHKKDLITTKKKIKVLKQIIEKDSLEHIKIEPISL